MVFRQCFNIKIKMTNFPSKLSDTKAYLILLLMTIGRAAMPAAVTDWKANCVSCSA